MQISSLLIILTIWPLLVAVVLATASRHKKNGSGKIQLLGAIGTSESKLDPEGAVIVYGELWQALSSDGETIAAQKRVRVVGFKDHLATVEACD
jgi:membrane-bound ClpP family serine protease